MQYVTFTVQTLTPTFITGADQNGAEIRAPSVRGLMRYWYRALIAGTHASNPKALEAVIEQESALFGATDRGSAVTVEVSTPSQKAENYYKEGSSRFNTTGKDYLLWSMAGFGKNRSNRQYFPEGTTFEVTLSSRGDNVADLIEAVNAFWLLMHLGSIGSRSRRCAGSLEASIKETSLDTADLAKVQFGALTSLDDLLNRLHNGIASARTATQDAIKIRKAQEGRDASQQPEKAETHSAIPQRASRQGPKQTAFDTLAGSECEIWLIYDQDYPWDTADDALREIGYSLQNYRSTIKPYERAVFGLPLKGVNERDRQASPLILRIAHLRDSDYNNYNEYIGVATIFKVDKTVSYQKITDWLQTFSGKDQVTF